MIAFLKKNPVFFACLFLSGIFLIFTRLYLLASIPGSLPHDELVYASQARSFVRTGKTLDGLQPWYALSPVHSAYAEWPTMLIAPGFMFFSDPMVASHATSAFMGITLPLLLGLLTYFIWKEKWVSVTLTLLVIASPLHWQLSRVGYDAWYSYWWYVVGGLILVAPFLGKNTSKGLPKISQWAKVLAILPLTIGFFQYQGFKLLLLPWVAFILALFISSNSYKELTQLLQLIWNKKWLAHKNIQNITQQALLLLKSYLPELVVAIFALSLTLFYALVLMPSQGVGERLKSTVFSDTTLHEDFQFQVNTERRLSLSSPVDSFMSNKYVSTNTFLLKRLTGAFDLRSLFIAQDASVSGFAVWSHGLFYWMDAIAIMLGLAYLMTNPKRRFSGILMLGAILVLSTPALINTQSEWYMLRMVLSYAIVLWLAAWMIKLIGSSKILVSGFIFLYIVGVLNFSYHYFYRYPVLSLDWSNFDKRIIAEYVWRIQAKTGADTPIIIYNSEPEAVFFALIAYARSNDIVDLVEKTGQKHTNTGFYTLGSITIQQACWDGALPENGIAIVQNTQPCEGVGRPADWITIPAVLDSGERHAIYGDVVCKGLELKSFVHLQSATDLRLPALSDQEFCQNWLTNLSNY